MGYIGNKLKIEKKTVFPSRVPENRKYRGKERKVGRGRKRKIKRGRVREREREVGLVMVVTC